MANKSKKKGTEAETKAVKFMAGYGIKAKRKALTGSADCGDLDVECCMLGECIFEVKAGKQTANPNRSLLNEWMRQTREESKNAGRRGFLLVMRYNRSTKDADVWWEDSCYGWHHLFFDEWCETYA